jgi:hypothetical protein
VTLSVSSPQYWYQPGKMPRFTVRAVSSERQACEFNMGTKFVSAVITSGDRRMWSSADCATGAGGSNVVVLANGTPGVLRVTWDRRTSSPGCTGSALVRPGEYQVSATAASLHSAKVNLVLGAKGASGP